MGRAPDVIRGGFGDGKTEGKAREVVKKLSITKGVAESELGLGRKGRKRVVTISSNDLYVREIAEEARLECEGYDMM